MSEPTTQRRLAAILAADVVGYSRLMAADEVGTLSALKTRRKGVLEPLVAKHRGRVFKIAGDGVLVDFASAVNAVQCAIDLQQDFAKANADLPDDHQIVLRIGVHVGDVMVEGSDLYGDGVNIAARLEGLAEPGGVCVSAATRDHVVKRVSQAFEDMGELNLKNIAEPIRAYRVTIAGAAPIISLFASKTADEKTSIAVFPFTNMSGDPAQEYFADGITEDITNALSRIDSLFVVSRSSSNVYKGLNRRSQDIAKELGVRFLLNGSVRIAGGRVRVTAQLSDGLSGNQLWSERYESNLDDIFSVQDEMTRNVALALQIRLSTGDEARLWEGQTKVLRAWEKMVAARFLFNRFTTADNLEARRALEEALALDPKYTSAMTLLGLTYWWEARFNPAVDKDNYLRLAEQLAKNALSIDPGVGHAFVLLAQILLLRGEHDEAMKNSERSLTLSPSDAWAHGVYAMISIYSGEREKAQLAIRMAMRLSPHPPSWHIYYSALADMWAGSIATALDTAKSYLRKEPDDPFGYCLLATVFGFQENLDGAKEAVRGLLDRFPDFRVATFAPTQHYKESRCLDRVVDILRRAGLPD